jgi:glucans biosynthesis protein C
MLSYGILMWSLISLTIGICKRIFMRPNTFIRYIADSAYWLYLIHLPIVIWLQIAFAELPLHWAVKLLSVCTIAILLSIVLYDAFIRSTFIGAILNGKRKPRILFKRSHTVKHEATM